MALGSLVVSFWLTALASGKANVLGWNASHDPPIGKWGACCAEMDIWEANSRATAYTPHPCSIVGPYTCDGVECGDNSKEPSSLVVAKSGVPRLQKR